MSYLLKSMLRRFFQIHVIFQEGFLLVKWPYKVTYLILGDIKTSLENAT